jgi:citrate synthase
MTERDVLFEVTADNLETGLRGYPVGYCVTSAADPTEGLSYVGRSIKELHGWQPEQVIYLLYYGREGTQEEVAAFSRDLRERSPCSDALIDAILKLPRKGHPMKMFSAAILLCGMLEGVGDYREDCLNLIAKIPGITATVINHHAGWGATPASHPERGYMTNFAEMLNIPDVEPASLAEVFRLFNVLHYDHGGGNLSVFVGKAVASGLEDLYGSMASAMCALAGPRHGRANQDALEMVKSFADLLGPTATAEQVEKAVRNRLERKELVFGFGHAVLRVEDPRATVQYEEAKRHYSEHPLVRMAHLLRKQVPKVLMENPKISSPYPNVDAISGTLLTAAGFPYSDYYTLLFGLSRVVGIAIQIVYERCEARGGKGTPIVRPKYFFRPRQ